AKADTVTAQDKVQKLKLELARLEALQQEAPKLRERATVLDAAAPNDPQLAQFILQVQDAANASGIEWISVSPTPPVASSVPGLSEIALTMNVTGGYFQVQDFLVRLETLSRAVKVGTIGLTAGATTSVTSPTLNIALAMKMFVATVPAAPPSTSTTGTPTSTATAT
ncbi:MAG: type 4a pilus biogenesis protein PilO, partial [Actinobacteria bacterium]|nr:type 4a pilus biogenesis protein PilO [Actinomycetota bacterium]